MSRTPPDSADAPLDRAFAILTFVAGARRPVAIAEIAEATGVPLPSAHRLVANLEERGLLVRALGSKRLLAGAALVDLATRTIGSAFRTARRHAILEGAAAEIGEQCEIGVVRGTNVVYVDAVRVAAGAGLRFDPGSAAPIYCVSTGKIFMSRMDRTAREKLVRSLPLHPYTAKTIVDPDSLLHALDETRTRGFAKSDEEYVKGVVGCAVPILDARGRLVACLGVSVPQARLTFEALDRLIEPLSRAATALSRTLGDEDEEAGPVTAGPPA